MSFSSGLDQLDPALLAFVKCHVTSPVRWEVLRVLAGRDGAWLDVAQLARISHRPVCELERALAELAADGLLDVELVPTPDAPEVVSYRLASDEPTSVVLHRLIEATTHNRELRAIIAAHLQHVRQQDGAVQRASAFA